MSNHYESKPNRRTPFYQVIDGFRLPGFFSEKNYRSALAYKPRPGDLFISTYPKCGTTWVQNIAHCIFNNGRSFESVLEFLSQSPFLELVGGEMADTMERPGSIKVHLPFSLTPWSPEAKYIYVARNPKDCCVSFYHHTEKIAGYQFAGGSFDDFFELFVEGEVDFGDYFDNLLSWYEHRNDPNVLFLTYEDMKKDALKNILKIAEFMGSHYKEAMEKDNRFLRDVMEHSSFNYMQQNQGKYFGDLFKIPKDVVMNHPHIPNDIKEFRSKVTDAFEENPFNPNFIRKGIVGDWKNCFSEEQNERLEKKFRERTAGTDIPFLWTDAI